MINKFKRRSKQEEKPQKKRKYMGRPTLWKEDYIDQAFIACSEMGATEKQLAKLFKTNSMTLHVWKKKYEAFADAVRRGKDIFDTANVESNLLKRASGYKYKEKTIERGPDGTKRKVTIKHMAPDITAIIFWLKNRSAGRWRDFKAVTLAGDKDNPLHQKIEKEMTLDEATKSYMDLVRASKTNDRFSSN